MNSFDLSKCKLEAQSMESTVMEFYELLKCYRASGVVRNRILIGTGTMTNSSCFIEETKISYSKIHFNKK